MPPIAPMPGAQFVKPDSPSLIRNPRCTRAWLAPAPTELPADSLPAALDAARAARRHGDVRPLEEIEAEVIRFAIAHYRGQMSEVARRLQIGRSTLYRKLENLGLATEPESGPPQPVVNG